MTDRPKGVPESAELRLLMSTIRRDQRGVEWLDCPACGAVNRSPQPHDFTGCTECGQRWVVFGNALYLWKGKPKLKVIK